MSHRRPCSLRGALFAAVLLTVLPLLAVGCAPTDPREAALAERAAWTISVERWLQGEDGTVLVTARATGPVHAELKSLTVRIDLLDAEGAVLREDWRALDLSGFSRGVTQELVLKLPAVETTVEGLRLDPMPDPTPDQQARMEELPPAA